LLFLFAAAVQAEEFVVGQKDKSFSVKTLKIKVGDTVAFRNDDSFFHNIYSLSDVQTFDLGSFPQGPIAEGHFTKPGKVEVECAIHPSMRLVIEVTK